MLLSIIRDKVTSKVYQTSAEQSENSGIISKVIILRGLFIFLYTAAHIKDCSLPAHERFNANFVCSVRVFI